MRGWFYILLLFLPACQQNYVPKPYGYFRVDLPAHDYIRCDTVLPYAFDISSSANLRIKESTDEKYWIDIQYPALNAAIHCSYSRVYSNIQELSDDARRLVNKHLVKAEGIEEAGFSNPDNHVYGTFYELHGNVASTVQFILTDSIRHFFRGAVYFNNVPNKDSIAPMADYIKRDVIHLMESFSWR